MLQNSIRTVSFKKVNNEHNLRVCKVSHNAKTSVSQDTDAQIVVDLSSLYMRTLECETPILQQSVPKNPGLSIAFLYSKSSSLFLLPFDIKSATTQASLVNPRTSRWQEFSPINPTKLRRPSLPMSYPRKPPSNHLSLSLSPKKKQI
jgi:hypothetical protein